MWLAAFSSNSVLLKMMPLFGWRGMRHEGHFAEACGTFIGVDEVAEGVLAFFRRHFHDPAAFEAHLDAVDQRALIGERLRRAHDAVHPVLVGRCENFFRWDVGVAEHAVQCLAAAALPRVIIGEAEGEIGSGALYFSAL